MAAHQAMETFAIVPKPPGANIIDTRWVYKLKRDSAGRPTRCKARLVAKGFTQVKGLDFEEVFSPTVSSTSVRLLLALAALYDMDLMHLDFDTAFLYADVKEDIYVSMPPGYEASSTSGKELVLKLNRSLYGLKQSPRNWNHAINAVLLGFGLKRSKADPCVYVKQVAEGGCSSSSFTSMTSLVPPTLRPSCQSSQHTFSVTLSAKFSGRWSSSSAFASRAIDLTGPSTWISQPTCSVFWSATT